MDTSRLPIDLFSSSNEILLNPRLSSGEALSLKELANYAQEKLQLRGHVWIATSGSTATSVSQTKLVALSKKALQASARAVNTHLQVSSQDIWIQVLPHYHVGGLGIEVRGYLSDNSVIAPLHEEKWDVKKFYTALVEQGGTLSALVPAQIYDLIQNNLKAPSQLRAIVVGGGAMEVDLYKKARQWGWPILPSYGMTETASQIATASLDSLKSFDYPPLEMLSHAKARQSSEGFIELSADSLFTAYAQNTAAGFQVWDPKIDGWFCSEDKGQVHLHNVIIEGRTKDYIKIGGEGTNIAHLRQKLDQLAFSKNTSWPMQVTLIDSPSERLGQEIHFVSSLSEAETIELLELFKKEVMPYERPRKIHFVKQIPRSDLGKILWTELRKQI